MRTYSKEDPIDKEAYDHNTWAPDLTWSYDPIIQIRHACTCLRADDHRTGLIAYEYCGNCLGHGVMPITTTDLGIWY